MVTIKHILIYFQSSLSWISFFSPESNNLVSVSEAETFAQKMGSLYHETSALTGEHVAKAFECAVKLGHTNRVKQGRQSWRTRFDHFDSSWLPPISEYILHDCLNNLPEYYNIIIIYQEPV